MNIGALDGCIREDVIQKWPLSILHLQLSAPPTMYLIFNCEHYGCNSSEVKSGLTTFLTESDQARSYAGAPLNTIPAPLSIGETNFCPMTALQDFTLDAALPRRG